jgi:hypothetical protein
MFTAKENDVSPARRHAILESNAHGTEFHTRHATARSKIAKSSTLEQPETAFDCEIGGDSPKPTGLSTFSGPVLQSPPEPGLPSQGD